MRKCFLLTIACSDFGVLTNHKCFAHIFFGPTLDKKALQIYFRHQIHQCRTGVGAGWIDEDCRPLLREEGFTMEANTPPGQQSPLSAGDVFTGPLGRLTQQVLQVDLN